MDKLPWVVDLLPNCTARSRCHRACPLPLNPAGAAQDDQSVRVVRDTAVPISGFELGVF